MGQVVSFPAPPPMPAVARILARYDRPTLESFLAVAIDLLDVIDGSPDTEADGDETDCNGAEDEPCGWFALHGDGPGDAVADPGGCEHDGRELDNGY